MTPIAITCLVLSMGLLWGGLIASIMYLRRHPERAQYPPGAEAAEAAEEGQPQP